MPSHYYSITLCKGLEEGDIILNGNETTTAARNDVTEGEISPKMFFNGLKIKDNPGDDVTSGEISSGLKMKDNNASDDVTLKNGATIGEDEESEHDNAFLDNR